MMRTFECLKSRLETADDRTTILAVARDIANAPSTEFNASEYSALVEVFVTKLDPSVCGLITEAEFARVIKPVFAGRREFARDILCALVARISCITSRNTYQFQKLLEVIDDVQQRCMADALSIQSMGAERNHDLQQEQQARVLSSFRDRVFSFLHSGDTKSNMSVDSGAGSIASRYEARVLDGLKAALTPDSNKDVDFCAKIVSAFAFTTSENFLPELLQWILGNGVDAAVCQELLLNEDFDSRRQEQLIASVAIFGSAVKHNTILRRTLTKKLLVERTTTPTSGIRRLSQKIASYLTLVDPSLLSETLKVLVQAWSDQSKLVHAANFQQQYHVAVALVDVAKAMSEEQRMSMRESVHLQLVTTVPNYLQLADVSRRQLGMLLAETLTNLFVDSNDHLKFDYVEDDPLLTEFRVILSEGQTGPKVEYAKDQEEPKKTRVAKPLERKDLSVLLDSDDDEEDVNDGASTSEEALFKREIDEYTADRRNRPHYLRDCLEQLREKENYKRFATSLETLPQLVRDTAIGFDDLALEIVDVLLGLENRFNSPNFAKTRCECMELCLARRPELVSHCVRLIFSRKASMADRYFILSAMEGAAKYLSDEGRKESAVEEVPKQRTSEKKELGKVTWKSDKLAETEPKYVRNKFADVASQFIYPLLNVKEIGPCLNLKEEDHALMGKILWTIGKMLLCAKNAPCVIRISSSLIPILYTLRDQKYTSITHGCLFCYASIIDSVPPTALSEVFAEELNDWLSWIQECNESSRVDADPLLRSSLQMALQRLAKVFEKTKAQK